MTKPKNPRKYRIKQKLDKNTHYMIVAFKSVCIYMVSLYFKGFFICAYVIIENEGSHMGNIGGNKNK